MSCHTVIHGLALLPWLAAASLCVSPGPARAATSLSSICRIKGQEENVLQGLGIVVGLKGSGDGGSYLPTIRSLAAAMQLMGDTLGKGGAAELKDAKNVALVTVSAIVPAAGARQGDRIDCTIASVGSAKSLVGGRLFLTPLLGPAPSRGTRPEDRRVYALAEGPITIEERHGPDHRPDPRRLPPGRGFQQRLRQGRQDHPGAQREPRRVPGGRGRGRADQRADDFPGRRRAPWRKPSTR